MAFTKTARWTSLITLLVVGLCLPVRAEVIVNDFGDGDDFSQDADIYFIREAWEVNYNIPGNDADFIHQETDDDFWIFTSAPASTPGLINARVILLSTYAEFRTQAIGEGQSVYLGIRYKDNLATTLAPAPVYANSGGNNWVQIGRLGGEFDHAWKVAVISVAAGDVANIDGRYRFKIGEGVYDQGLKADVPIDRIELATSQAELTVEADDPGYYPAAGDGNFQGLDVHSPWTVDGQPFFPIGFAAGWNGIADNDWQRVADAGFNTILFYNWLEIHGGALDMIPDIWDTLPSSAQYGFSEFLQKSQDAGLKVIGVFQNDIKYFPVQDYFGNERATLDFVQGVCAQHANHPALLAWSQVDEPDHSYIPEFYAPLEWCMGLKQAIRQGDPNHPIYALEIGWRQGAFGHYRDIADYHGWDVYPNYGTSAAGIGDRAQQFIAETGSEKPFIAYLKAYDRSAGQANMSYGEAYVALIHGANGIFYWDLGASDPIFDTLGAIAGEINTLNPVLLPPAQTLDVNGGQGLCVDNSNAVQNRFIRDPDGDLYILSANTENAAANGVRFNVADLKSGTQIQVLFENRTITSAEGYFEDDFPAYGRLVYVLGDVVECTDGDQDGYALEGGACGQVDCEDDDDAIHPGADEVCDDGVDNDCDNATDDADDECSGGCTDSDQDGYSIEGDTCGSVDCNDGDDAVHPGADEVCDDGVDNNCDGNTDENNCGEPDGEQHVIGKCGCRAADAGSSLLWLFLLAAVWFKITRSYKL